MTTYTITKATEECGILTTTVLYNIDGTPVQVDIAHFQPQTLSDIILGITNRALTEKNKLTAMGTCETLLTQITLNEVVTI